MEALDGERTTWSRMPPVAMLVSVVHAAAPAHDEAWGPCGHMQSVPLTDALAMTSDFAVLGSPVMLLSVACITTEAHKDVWAWGCGLKTC